MFSQPKIKDGPAPNNGTETYTYDNVGNRLTLSSTIPALPGSVSYSYDPNDRLLSDTYDSNGNTIFSLGTTNTYDFENHLLQHGSSVTIVYDGDGNRVSETAGGVTTKYLVDTLNPTGYSQVIDELVSGSVTRTYAYGLQRIDDNQLVSSTWMPTFYGYDGQGNVRFLANASGTATDTYQFDAFGNLITSTGATSNPYLYSGERFDSNLNLYHLRARYYNVLTGRFENMDPGASKGCCARHSRPSNIFDPGSLHNYVYAQNNPVNRIDPSGKDSFFDYVTSLGESRESIEELRRVEWVVKIEVCVEDRLIEMLQNVEMYGAMPFQQLYSIALEECLILDE